MTLQTIETRSTEAGVPWINASGAESGAVSTAVEHVSREIANWVTATRGGAQARPSLFNRQAYVAPDNPYTLMQTARNAVENDDIVGGVCDVVEGLMLQGIKWEAEDPEDASFPAVPPRPASAADDFERRAKRARRDDWALDDQLIEPGLVAVSVPVREPDTGRVACVASGDVHAHTPGRSRLQDALVAVRLGATLEETEPERRGNSASVIMSADEVTARFVDHPEAVAESGRLAERLGFDLTSDLDDRNWRTDSRGKPNP